MDEQLHDCERVSTPWAKLSAGAPGAAPVLELLPERITDLGIQGVRPLGPGEPRMLPMSEAERVLSEVVSRASGPSRAA